MTTQQTKRDLSINKCQNGGTYFEEIFEFTASWLWGSKTQQAHDLLLVIN
jgi:hypothetical protein